MSDRLEEVPDEPAVVATATDATVGNTTEAKSCNSQNHECIAKVCAWGAFLLVTVVFVFLAVRGYFSLGRCLMFASCIICAIGFLSEGISLRRGNNRKDTITVSLLFLLAVLAVAAAGVLPIYFFPCVDTDPVYSYYDDAIKNGFELVTETESLPSEVQSWWENVTIAGWSDPYRRYSIYSRSNGNKALYLNTTGVSLFTDTDGQEGDNDDEYLYRIENGNSQDLVKEIVWPRDFVLVEDDAALACFIFETTGNRFERKVACTDGVHMNQTEETFSYASNLFYSNDLIWFRCTIHSEEIGYGDDVLYSMDPFSPGETLTLHSSLDDSFDASAPRECSNESTLRSISWLCLSSIPSLLIAIKIELVYKAPTMPIGIYLSTTWMVVSILFVMFPYSFDGSWVHEIFKWWSVFTTLPWLVLLTFMHLTNRITKHRLIWSINFAALVYTVGAFLLTEVFREDFAWDWVWLTIAVVPILSFISILTGQMFLMILAALVILIDVWRLTDYIVYDVGNWNRKTPSPVQYAVLAVTALLLTYLIVWLVKQQTLMQTAVSNWAKSKLSCWWRQPPSIPSGDNECPTHATSSMP